MVPVTPAIEIVTTPGQTLIEAHVMSAAPAPILWRLKVSTHAGSNRSEVAQSGRTDGSNRAPVAVVRVNAPGEADLEVRIEGQIAGEVRRSFAAPSAEAGPY